MAACKTERDTEHRRNRLILAGALTDNAANEDERRTLEDCVVVTAKEDALIPGTTGEPAKPAPASSILSIEDVIRNVKPDDINI